MALSKQQKEVEEKLEVMGQEDEHQGIRWTKYFMDQFDKKEWEKDQIHQQRLERKAKFSKKGYYDLCAQMMNQEAQTLDLALQFRLRGYATKYGVALEMRDIKTGRMFTRGMKPCGIPKYDYYATVVLLMQAQNTEEHVMATPLHNTTPGGIALS